MYIPDSCESYVTQICVAKWWAGLVITAELPDRCNFNKSLTGALLLVAETCTWAKGQSATGILLPMRTPRA